MNIEASNKKIRLIIIVGPTAVGKSALAVRVARAVNGEVISADSRQVYKGLNIGSGKITRAEMKGVPHHLLDIVSPKARSVFTVADFQKAGQKAIAEIAVRGKVPIICGGTGFYIQALVDSVIFPDVPPNKKLRAKLEKKSVTELARLLKKLDPRRYREIDKKNPRRLIRAIEIATALGKVPTFKKSSQISGEYNPLFIGLTVENDILRARIKKRLDSRFKQGMIAEVRKLHADGVSWRRLEIFGLEYRQIARFLQKKISRQEMTKRLEIEIGQYAKRQMLWFKRDKRVKWFGPKEWTEVRAHTLEFIRKS